MQTLVFLLKLAVFVGFIAALILCADELNRHSRNTYKGFAPVNWRTVVASTVFCSLLVVGIALLKDQGEFPPWPWPAEFLESRAFNALVVFGMDILIALGLFAFLWRKTSFLTALASFFLLLLIAVLVIAIVGVILTIVVVLIDARRSQRSRR